MSAIERDKKYVEDQIDDIEKEIKATNKIIVSIETELIRKRDLRQMIKVNQPTSAERYLRENQTAMNVLRRTLAVNKKNVESMILQRKQLMSDVITYIDDLRHLKEYARTKPSVPSKSPPPSPKIIPTPTPQKVLPTPQKAPPTPPVDPVKKPKSGRNRRRGQKDKGKQ
jgi:hypothetical protein